jgi:hypothetical protein
MKLPMKISSTSGATSWTRVTPSAMPSQCPPDLLTRGLDLRAVQHWHETGQPGEDALTVVQEEKRQEEREHHAGADLDDGADSTDDALCHLALPTLQIARDLAANIADRATVEMQRTGLQVVLGVIDQAGDLADELGILGDRTVDDVAAQPTEHHEGKQHGQPGSDTPAAAVPA